MLHPAYMAKAHSLERAPEAAESPLVVASSQSFEPARGVKRVGCDSCPSDVSTSSLSDEDDLDVDADEHDAKRPRRDAGDVKDAAEILASIFVKVPASPPASPTFRVVVPAAEMPPTHHVEPGTGTTCLDRLQSLGAAKISRLRAHGVSTVEALAKIHARDPRVQLITGNKRPDRAAATMARWRGIAQQWLARQSGACPLPPLSDKKKKRAKPRRKRLN